MQGKKVLWIAVAVVGVGVAWYLFRPERLFINKTVSEELTPASRTSPASATAPLPLATGSFHSVAQESRGTATVFQYADGKRVLRFTDFETSNGPEVKVYLVAAGDAKDNESVKKAGFVNLGPLKGNRSDQNYDIPADLDLARYRAVTIWCQRFGVNFATAPLVSSPQG